MLQSTLTAFYYLLSHGNAFFSTHSYFTRLDQFFKAGKIRFSPTAHFFSRKGVVWTWSIHKIGKELGFVC